MKFMKKLKSLKDLPWGDNKDTIIYDTRDGFARVYHLSGVTTDQNEMKLVREFSIHTFELIDGVPKDWKEGDIIPPHGTLGKHIKRDFHKQLDIERIEDELTNRHVYKDTTEMRSAYFNLILEDVEKSYCIRCQKSKKS